MDIEDILQEFENSALAQNRASEPAITSRLVRAMFNERMAPELLPYQHELMRQVLDALTAQQQFLLDSHEYGDLNAALGVILGDFKLQLMIVETEVERLNYLVRSYLRLRLAKLDKYNVYYVQLESASQKSNNDKKPLLSSEEAEYIHEHFKILTQLYNASFLKRMPHFLTLLDDISGGQLMVVEPNLNQPVFVRVLSTNPVTVRTRDEILELERGSIYVVNYRLVSRYIQIGDIGLI